MDEGAAVPIGGEAFAALAVLFVLGMLAIAVARLIAKSRKSSRPARRDNGDVHVPEGDGHSRGNKSDTGWDGGGDGGGGDGGGD